MHVLISWTYQHSPKAPASEDEEVATQQQIAEAAAAVDVGSQRVDSIPVSDLPQAPESFAGTIEPASFTPEAIPVFVVETDAQAVSTGAAEVGEPSVTASLTFVPGPAVGNGEHDMTNADD